MTYKQKMSLAINLKDMINSSINGIIIDENMDERSANELDILLDDGYLRVIVEEEVLKEIENYLKERI